MKKIYILASLFSITIGVLAQGGAQDTSYLINKSNDIGMSYLKTQNNNKRIAQQSGIAEFRIGGKITEFENLDNFSDLDPAATTLTIQNKDLTHLDISVTKLRNLELIDVSHNQLTDIDVAIFESLKKLKRVYINNNMIADETVEKWRVQFPEVLFYTDKEIYYDNNTESKTPLEK